MAERLSGWEGRYKNLWLVHRNISHFSPCSCWPACWPPLRSPLGWSSWFGSPPSLRHKRENLDLEWKRQDDETTTLTTTTCQQVSWCEDFTCVCGLACSCGRTLWVMWAVSCTQAFAGLLMTMNQQRIRLTWRICNNKTLLITPRVKTRLLVSCGFMGQRFECQGWCIIMWYF